MSERQRGTALDATAMIAMVAFGQLDGLAAMANSYTDADELRELAIALTGLAGTLLNAASEASGIPPEKFLGTLVANVRAAA